MSEKSKSSSALDSVKQLLIAVILAIIIKTSIVEAYKIPTESMEDTLLVGDFLLANKTVYGARLPLLGWRLPAISDPQPGDIVIFLFPMDGVTKYIKRCIAGPGDTVEVKDKIVYVNGRVSKGPLHSKYVDTLADGEQKIKPLAPRDNFGPYVVPVDSYFMMGDNRDNSYDSRFWGAVRRDHILGKAMMIHWSWNDENLRSPAVEKSDPLSVPRLFLYNTVHFYEKVRWGRLFSAIQ